MYRISSACARRELPRRYGAQLTLLHELWKDVNEEWIHFGRETCTARNPKLSAVPMSICPSYEQLTAGSKDSTRGHAGPALAWRTGAVSARVPQVSQVRGRRRHLGAWASRQARACLRARVSRQMLLSCESDSSTAISLKSA